MVKAILRVVAVLCLVSVAYASEYLVSAVHGRITKIDSASKTIVVRTADGTEHSLRFLDKTAVHGARTGAEGGNDSWRGLKEGTEVIAHCTKRGGEDTALEIDKVGQGGLRTTVGTITEFDRAGKKLVVKGSDGVESRFRLTDHSAKDGGRDIAEGSEKGTKVTVYYTGDAGKKIAHFFEKG
jgi:hypothetical protein